MKTITGISATGISAAINDPRDGLFKPSKTFKRGWLLNADGLHFYSQPGDGKTTTHTFIKLADLTAMVEAHEPDYKVPPEAQKTRPAPNVPAKAE